MQYFKTAALRRKADCNGLVVIPAQSAKGPAYERWAKVYNLKQMAAALQYLKEHQLFEYDDLAAKTDAATEQFHTLAGDIQQTEAELSRVSDLMAAVLERVGRRKSAAQRDESYISLTEIARAHSEDAPGYVIQRWLRSEITLAFLNL